MRRTSPSVHGGSRGPLPLTVLLFLIAALPGQAKQSLPAPLDRDQAIEILLREVIQPRQVRGEIIAYGGIDPLPPGTHIVPYLPTPAPEGDFVAPILSGGVVLEREKWFFYVDDHPRAEFSHETRFVWIDVETGLVSVVDERWWPMINGESRWTSEAERFDPGQWVFSQLDEPFVPSPPPPPAPLAPVFASSGPIAQQAPGDGVGIVINGWKEGETDGHFETNAGIMEDKFKKLGLKTTRLGPTTSPPATKAELYKWIADQAKNLGPCEDMFIYITAHGYKSNFSNGVIINGESIPASSLAQKLRAVNKEAHVYVQVQACHSGRFASTLTNAAAVEGVDTSCNSDEKSYDDSDPANDPNPGDTGSEHTSGFAEDYDRILGNPAKVKAIKEQAQKRGISWRGLVFGLAKKSALEKDADAINKRTHPADFLKKVRVNVRKAVEDLEDLISQIPDETPKKRAENAARQLDKATDESGWKDDDTPKEESAGAIFQSGAAAVRELEMIIGETPIEEDLSVIRETVVIGLIAVAEFELTRAEEAEPQSVGDEHDMIRSVSSARKKIEDMARRLSLGAGEQSFGQYRAVESAGEAWKHAARAIAISEEVPQTPPPFLWQELIELRSATRGELIQATYGQVNNPHSPEGNALLAEAGRTYEAGVSELEKGHAEKAWGLLGEALQQAGQAGASF